MADTRVTLRSPYDPQSCVKRIEAHAELSIGKPAGVVGRIQDGRLLLRMRRPAMNSFAPVLSAKMKPDRGGTIIDGRIGMPRSATGFMVFWFGFLAVFMLFAWGLFSIGADGGFWFALPFYAVPIFMAVMGAWMIVAGRRMGRGDRAALLAFLEEAIDARPDEPAYRLY
ncbi:MAG: hypothetical protein ABR601_01475 [Parasphingopyxis sp.]|nr:hypothetical protein [Sphingomonadales bacterium]